MKKEKILLNSSFEISGQILSRTVDASFGIIETPIERVEKTEGVKSFAQTGIITKNTGFYNDVVPNAKVVALRKGVVYDYDITREDGSYFLYLENGVYDIRIEGQACNRIIKNYEVTNGIKPYRTIITEGQIKKRNHDVIEFTTYDENNYPVIDDGERLVSGVIIDEQGKPVEGAEIIVGRVINEDTPSREIVAFVKTKKDGVYRFKISRENYDIIIRSPKHNAKTVKDFLFVPDKGFMPQVINNALMFRKGGEWIWISN